MPPDAGVYSGYLDYLTCGKCAQEFPLQNITDFINHKTSTCHQELPQHNVGIGFNPGSQEPALSCFICQRDFRTARGVLQHIQFEHSLKIFMQKAPLSVDRPFLVDDRHSVFTTQSAANKAGPHVTTITTTTNNNSTSIMRVSDNVTLSPSNKSNLPVMCAKLESTDGTTICCNGTECKVTINPPKTTASQKKCCSSVIPKKRGQHMKEHVSGDAELEHQEQTALETLATLRGRVLLSQQAGTCKTASRNVTSAAVCNETSCDRVNCDVRNDGTCDEGCASFSCNDDDDDSGMVCSDHACDKDETEEMQIISISEERITDRQTVVIKPGVAVSFEAKPLHSEETNTQMKEQSVRSQGPADASLYPDQTSTVVDADRESAQILAEMMYQAVTQASASQITPPQDPIVHMQPTIPLTSVHETISSVPFTDPTRVLAAPSTHLAAVSPAPQLVPAPFSMDSVSSISNPVSSSPPFLVNKALDNSSPASSSVVDRPLPSQPQPLDIHQLPDLDMLTSSIHLFESLDQVSVDSSNSHYEGSNSRDIQDLSRQKEIEKFAEGVRKRRYPTSRPFKCSDCDQAFNQRIHLKKHMSKHTGVKPFKCGECEYSTVERSHLRAHVRIHTGEKPFSCPHCDYATAQNSTLKIHLKRHHSNKQKVSDVLQPQL